MHGADVVVAESVVVVGSVNFILSVFLQANYMFFNYQKTSKGLTTCTSNDFLPVGTVVGSTWSGPAAN